jgi:hypothetical protein
VKGNLYFLPIKNNVEMAQIRKDTMDAQKNLAKNNLGKIEESDDEAIITFERNNIQGSEIEFGGP